MIEPDKTTTSDSSQSTPYKRFVARIHAFGKKVDAVIEHWTFVTFMTLLTVYVLFADDIRSLIPNKNVDTGFYVVASISLGLFLLEIALQSLAKPGYFLGFFFWLDLVSTASLIFDIGWISDLIFGTGGSNSAASATKLARAGRASRVGTRAGRIVRVVRLVRFLKLLKTAQSIMAQNQVDLDEDEDDNGSQEGSFNRTVSANPNQLEPGSMTQTDSKGMEVCSVPKKGSNGSKDGSKEGSNNHPLKRKDSTVPRRDSKNPRKGSMNSDPRTSIRKHGPSGFAPKNNSDTGSKDSNEPKTSLPVDNASAVAPQQSQDAQADNKTNVPASQADGQPAATPEGEYNDPTKFEIPQETNVGKKLSGLTTKRVISVVMSVLVSIPIFDLDTFWNDLTSCEVGLYTLYSVYNVALQNGDWAGYNNTLDYYIDYHKDIRNKLLSLEVASNYSYSVYNTDLLRDSEKQIYTAVNNSDPLDTVAIFDQRDDTHLNGILSISGTIFVTIVLTTATLLFSKDSTDLVITPIENMLKKVKRISDNPLDAARIEEEEAMLFESLQKEGKFGDINKKKEGDNYETTILEQTILKLGALLALGFGEAGSNIIAQNMAKSGSVDPMIPGKKVMGIYGFCDIRQFTDATEVLQEGVMVFVNEIAEVVHGTINDFSGAANKNIGDAFLLVWKIPDEEVEQDEETGELKLKEESATVSALADMSIFSFIKLMANVNKSKKLEKYRSHQGLNQRLGNYRVKMGFGLHIGWSIEGAIGSEFKVDVSYLSPNVKMSERLEGSTKGYGVPLLISGDLAKLCTPETQKFLRHVDRVEVSKNAPHMDLYTCDVDISKLTVEEPKKDTSTMDAMEKKQMRFKNRMKRDKLKDEVIHGKQKISKKFFTDKNVALMRKPFSREFYELFEEGMEHYISGNWPKARDIFEKTATMPHTKEKDGPSVGLLNFMADPYHYRAPHDWKGYRAFG